MPNNKVLTCFNSENKVIALSNSEHFRNNTINIHFDYKEKSHLSLIGASFSFRVNNWLNTANLITKTVSSGIQLTGIEKSSAKGIIKIAPTELITLPDYSVSLPYIFEVKYSTQDVETLDFGMFISTPNPVPTFGGSSIW